MIDRKTSRIIFPGDGVSDDIFSVAQGRIFTHMTLRELIDSQKSVLDNKSHVFLENVYSKREEEYSTRLRRWGFEGKSRVLDAGCGFGQWTTAMATINDQVVAIDVSLDRTRFVSLARDVNNLDNIYVTQGRLDALGFGPGSFDAVFCYGALFLTDWKNTLKEFSRVLVSGGRLYVNANGIGWYKHLWYNEHNKTDGYDPKLVAAKAFMNTWRYGSGLEPDDGVDIMIEPDELRERLSLNGFTDITTAAEGRLNFSGDDGEIEPFFKGEYMGDLGVYEVVAIKA